MYYAQLQIQIEMEDQIYKSAICKSIFTSLETEVDGGGVFVANEESTLKEYIFFTSECLLLPF